jgi:hypothetical protein
VEVVNELWNKTKNGINEVAGKIIGKEEWPQKYSWFDEECQMTLENKKGTYNTMIKRNARKN